MKQRNLTDNKMKQSNRKYGQTKKQKHRLQTQCKEERRRETYRREKDSTCRSTKKENRNGDWKRFLLSKTL
jgi:phage terminase large subunit-like protein